MIEKVFLSFFTRLLVIHDYYKDTLIHFEKILRAESGVHRSSIWADVWQIFW